MNPEGQCMGCGQGFNTPERIAALEKKCEELRSWLIWALDNCPKKNTFGWTKERQEKYVAARRASEER